MDSREPLDGEANINIMVSGSVQILCIAPAGTDITAKGWQIRQVVQAQDSNFGGYPYTRTLWPLNPDTGKPTSVAELIAANALTYTFI